MPSARFVGGFLADLSRLAMASGGAVVVWQQCDSATNGGNFVGWISVIVAVLWAAGARQAQAAAVRTALQMPAGSTLEQLYDRMSH